jgi:predicted metal-dependent hydrolase
MGEVRIVKKAVKRIYLKVKPDGEAVLTVPPDVSEREIVQILEKRAAWIARQREIFASVPRRAEPEYVSGENIRYLGRNYRLKVIASDDERVSLQRGILQLFVKDPKATRIKKALVEGWLRAKAERHFAEALACFAPLVGERSYRLRIRTMKTRWGSCNPQTGNITLNLHLIEKPKICIEYVALHELAHLVHSNHGRVFYNFLSMHMPDWKKRKILLETS